MNTTDNWLVHDHGEYEELLSHCREAVESEDWESVKHIFTEFIQRLKAHVDLEEQVLYPAYESKSAAPKEPTDSLRHEHDKLIQYLRGMLPICSTRNSEPFLECLVEFEKLLIKHHEKEEDIFLPMAGLILQDEREELLRKIREFDPSKSKRKWDI